MNVYTGIAIIAHSIRFDTIGFSKFDIKFILMVAKNSGFRFKLYSILVTFAIKVLLTILNLNL